MSRAEADVFGVDLGGWFCAPGLAGRSGWFDAEGEGEEEEEGKEGERGESEDRRDLGKRGERSWGEPGREMGEDVDCPTRKTLAVFNDQGQSFGDNQNLV